MARRSPAASLLSPAFYGAYITSQTGRTLFSRGERLRATQEQGARLSSLYPSEFAPLPEPAIRAGVRAMTAVVVDLLVAPSGAEGKK